MTGNTVFAESQIHHIALRVADAKASKAWFLTRLGYRVDREFSFGGMDFVWLCPSGSSVPVIELISGGKRTSRFPYANFLESLKQPGVHHICLQVNNLEQVMAELRRRDVKILIDVIPGAPGTGVAKGAFIADPWKNIFELLELAQESKATRQPRGTPRIFFTGHGEIGIGPYVLSQERDPSDQFVRFDGIPNLFYGKVAEALGSFVTGRSFAICVAVVMPAFAHLDKCYASTQSSSSRTIRPQLASEVYIQQFRGSSGVEREHLSKTSAGNGNRKLKFGSRDTTHV